MNTSRRLFLKLIGFYFVIVTLLADVKQLLCKAKTIDKDDLPKEFGLNIQQAGDKHRTNLNLGVENDGYSYVYIAKNDTAETNTKQAIKMMGGIKEFVGKNDIVILKPNAQWWNQGMTNTDSMKAFIDLILEMPDFLGEIIIAENHHFLPVDSRGWTTKKRNGKYNINELVEHFNKRGYTNVTKYHWRDGGKNTLPLQGDDGDNGVVDGPGDKDGYVWRKDIVYRAPNGRKCMMTYPLFTSSYSGIQIDFKNGPWRDGKYQDIPVKLVNFSALNHHSIYSGVTAAIKNYMGIVDMTCGFHGPAPKGYYNTHYIGVSRLMKYQKMVWRSHWRIAKYLYRNFHYTGGALGFFMKNIKMADLNIITAERIGYGSRIDLKKSALTKAIIASKDPVAIDLVASERFLSEVTPDKDAFRKSLNNGFNKKGPFYKFIRECHKCGIGNLSKTKIKKIEYDAKHG